MAGAVERLVHVEELRPEICTLDCGTMNFAAGGDYVLVNTPAMLRAMAARVRELGVRPELEVFDTGHLSRPRADPRRVDRRPAADPAVHGHPVQARPTTSARFWRWSADCPATRSTGVLDRADGAAVVALAPLVRGERARRLEDNPYPRAGASATNGELVARAVEFSSA
jgi:uncharacterized protein (DUF849 family)